MMNFVNRFMRNEDAASAIEYSLLAALISMAAVAAMGTVGTSVSTSFSKVASTLQ